MAGVLTAKALFFTGFILLVIGAERLLNAYLLGAGPSSRIRILLGTFCVMTGGLITLIAYVTSRTRR
jgi:hypothetical protein